MKKQKIVIVGGGSCFLLSKVKVIIEKKEIFEGSEICLFDIDSKYFSILIKACEELFRREKINLKITSSTNPKDAFRNASFIYFVWSAGGKNTLKNDIEIPERFNIIGDETAGVGGTFMAQRNIPIAINYCRIIESICPDAWIISLTNPTNLIADAVRRETNVRFIAVCDCICEFAMKWLPKVMNIPPFERAYHTSEELWPRAIGVNHYTWLVKLTVKGKDGYPLLRKIIRKDKEKLMSSGLYERVDLAYNLFEGYDYFNIAPIHAQPYYEHDDNLERNRNFDNTFYSGAFGWNRDKELQVKKIIDGGDYNPSPWNDSRDYCFELSTPRQLIGIMASIITNDGREWGGINFPNTGIISNLPQNSIIEGPAIINKMGINPIPMGELPKPFIGLSNQLINWADLSVDAALSGNKKILYQAILANPLILNMRAAKELMIKMMNINSNFLPQYKSKKF